MGFFTAKKDEKVLEQGGNSNYITKSGVYDVEILSAIVNVSKNGSTSIDFFLDYNGQKQVFYGNLRIRNNDDSVNEIGDRVFNQLLITAGVDSLDDPVEVDLPIGKNGKVETVSVLEDLSNVKVKMQSQMLYEIYDKNILEKKIIKAFYRSEDSASAKEVVNGEGIGEQFEKDKAYFNNVTYKNGLDETAISKWIAKGRPKGDASSATSEERAPTQRPTFGSKKQ